MKQEKINEFAQQFGYDYAEYLCDWNGYAVYARRKYSKQRILSGPTRFILVKEENITLSSVNIAEKIIDEIL